MAMWQRFNNLISSLQTYDALSPDLKMRQQVNRVLRQRPALSPEQWFELFALSPGMMPCVATFAYEKLARYSGLEIGCVLPSDRLNEDLYWTQVCWFDWEFTLCQDFCQQFGGDLDDLDNLSDCLNARLEAATLVTVEDLLTLLNQHRRRLER
jgi:hypothetical protein